MLFSLVSFTCSTFFSRFFSILLMMPVFHCTTKAVILLVLFYNVLKYIGSENANGFWYLSLPFSPILWPFRFPFHIQLGIIRLTLMQRKDGSNLLMLLSKQFHKRGTELFFFCGETLLSRKSGPLICNVESYFHPRPCFKLFQFTVCYLDLTEGLTLLHTSYSFNRKTTFGKFLSLVQQ